MRLVSADGDDDDNWFTIIAGVVVVVAGVVIVVTFLCRLWLNACILVCDLGGCHGCCDGQNNFVDNVDQWSERCREIPNISRQSSSVAEEHFKVVLILK